MTKPIEETWVALEASDGDERLLYTDEEGDDGGPFEIAKFCEWRPEDDRKGTSVARAKLAAKAPEMARMLLKREWGYDSGGTLYCRSCKTAKYDQPRVVSAHRSGCAWLALMKAIGAR